MECYLKVKDDADAALMEKCWMKVKPPAIGLRRRGLRKLQAVPLKQKI